MTNSLWVVVPFFFCPAVSSHSITNRKWVTMLFYYARQLHYPSSLINRLSVTLAFYQTLSSLCILWPIASEWHCPLFSKTCSPLISSYNQQLVSDSAYLCHCPGHHISPHNQQAVSDFDTLESGQESHPIPSHHQQNVSDSSNISA